MKCSIMLHFIWVFTVCKKYSFRSFQNTKGKAKAVVLNIPRQLGVVELDQQYLFQSSDVQILHSFP